MINLAELKISELHLNHFFIAGKWVTPRGTKVVPVINPVRETAICEMPLGNAQDVDDAVSAASAAFASWGQTPPENRARLLTRLVKAMEGRSEQLAQCLTLEMGVALNYARSAQVPMAIEHVRTAKKVLENFEFVQERRGTAIAYEPIGVCALITPWNWPLYQITAKVAPALAAGCTVVLKPSELAPLSALLFAELIEECSFPPGVFNLVQGDGSGVGTALAGHPDVQMISITGSTRAGIAVAKTAADTVKRVAQELGGKSPNLVLTDADLERAVSLGVAAGMRNLGQSCSAPTRMIVPRERLAQAEAFAIDALNKIVVGDPLDPTVTHGAIANRAQFERIQSMIHVGIAEGACLIAGGPGRPNGITQGFFVRPTIFSQVHTEMRIAQEEIFGPVLCILPYDSLDQAIAIANDSPYGLGAHVQGSDIGQMRAVAAQIRAGQVHLNYPAWDPYAPFGGYKQSGNGREYGREGMLEYLEVKSILGYVPAN